MSLQKPNKVTYQNGEIESKSYQTDSMVANQDYDFEYDSKSKLDELEIESSNFHHLLTTKSISSTKSIKPAKKLEKSVEIVCNSDSYLYKINFDIESIDNSYLIKELYLNEEDLKNVECKTTNSSISIQFKNTNTAFKLNFNLEKKSELISQYMHKEFKLSLVEFKLTNNKTRQFSNESLSKIVKGHSNTIECSNSKQVNINSNVILNIDNYKMDIFARCIKIENKWGLMYRCKKFYHFLS